MADVQEAKPEEEVVADAPPSADAPPDAPAAAPEGGEALAPVIIIKKLADGHGGAHGGA